MKHHEVHAQVCAYDDPDTPATVRSLLVDPGLPVRVTVLLQTNSPSLVDRVRDEGADIIHVKRQDTWTFGWARAMVAGRWLNEPWVCGFDSHTRVVEGWAAKLKEQSGLVPRKSVFTTYPSSLACDIGADGPFEVHPMILKPKDDQKWYNPGRPGFVAKRVADGPPQPARMWAGGFWWAPSDWQREVPVDPTLSYGRHELLTFIRSWTAGWDFWHPGIGIAAHRYGRQGRPMFWNDHPVVSKQLTKLNEERWAQLIRDKQVTAMGLGSVRTLEEWETWTGCSLADRSFVPDDEWRTTLN